jgi:hypothetical protein
MQHAHLIRDYREERAVRSTALPESKLADFGIDE